MALEQACRVCVRLQRDVAVRHEHPAVSISLGQARRGPLARHRRCRALLGCTATATPAGRELATCATTASRVVIRRQPPDVRARDPRRRPARVRRRLRPPMECKHLGGRGLHPGAASGRQHDDCCWAVWHAHLPSSRSRSPAWLRSRTSSFKGSRAAGLPHRGMRGVLHHCVTMTGGHTVDHPCVVLSLP